MKRTGTTETSVERTPHEHYDYELGNATRVPENPGNQPVSTFLTLIASKQAIQRKKTAVG